MPGKKTTSPDGTDSNAILFEYNPTGAGSRTAASDRLTQKGIFGVKASQTMAETDGKRVMAHREKFVAAGRQFDLPPALLAAIASRESRGGAALKNGFGDGGNGFGIMQVDKRSHTIEGSDDPAGLPHIMQATRILHGARESVRRKHPDWPAERQLQGAVVAYNAGVRSVQTLDGMDQGTTGDDYSNDVWARAQFYAQQMGSKAPSTLPGAILTLAKLEQLTFPAPAMTDVEAGRSALQRKQQGEAVAVLQQGLLTLNYLTLTEEQKASGMGTFGPLTEKALQAFQRDAYLPATGVYDLLTHTALQQLLRETIKKGADNHTGLVKRLQDRLVALNQIKREQVGGGYGTFGPLTEGGLKRFQMDQKLAGAQGVLTIATYLALRAAAPTPPPVVDMGTGDDKKIESQLPKDGPGFIAKGGSTARNTQFATERTLNRVLSFAALWMQSHPKNPLRIGEMSIQGGGKFGGHKGQGHATGIALDIGLFRKDGENRGTTFTDSTNYNQKLTQDLVTALDQSPNVFLIVFNDPGVTAGAKLKRDRKGLTVHNNHLHVEFGKR